MSLNEETKPDQELGRSQFSSSRCFCSSREDDEPYRTVRCVYSAVQTHKA